ncbi:hypothetical protein [Hymenobacter latericus]|uniref:hypothetical protein n=1 Tax=Hymenobacter sp. YIM 151858-1 TaxID=2987688 RepID=UPI002226FE7F|nr:hypothetical protein [Hymenobacter sp. YIM 151858-1]UYZ60114.1 hypothetical protein OIS50_04760 [Hymenobacter sp. YIM 151858-1]
MQKFLYRAGYVLGRVLRVTLRFALAYAIFAIGEIALVHNVRLNLNGSEVAWQGPLSFWGYVASVFTALALYVITQSCKIEYNGKVVYQGQWSADYERDNA